MARTSAKQRKLPGYEVRKNLEISNASPYGSRRYANKVSDISHNFSPSIVLVLNENVLVLLIESFFSIENEHEHPYSTDHDRKARARGDV